MNMKQMKTITVGQLRDALSLYADDTPMFFGSGDLSFSRVKNRDGAPNDLVQIEFGEIYQITQDFTGE